MNRPPTPQTDPRLLVLHALRCAGACGLARLRAVTGLDATRLDFVLIDHTVDGLTDRVSDDPPCWQLTDAGRAEHARLIAEELAAAGARASVEAAFDGFLVLNPELLDLCTAWQLRTVDGVTTANDHRDAAYDARVLGRFADLDQRAAVVCAELAEVLPRFGRYRVRLADALSRASSGALEYVTDDTTSYHTVWAEWHEDLLLTLGKSR